MGPGPRSESKNINLCAHKITEFGVWGLEHIITSPCYSCFSSDYSWASHLCLPFLGGPGLSVVQPKERNCPSVQPPQSELEGSMCIALGGFLGPLSLGRSGRSFWKGGGLNPKPKTPNPKPPNPKTPKPHIPNLWSTVRPRACLVGPMDCLGSRSDIPRGSSSSNYQGLP